jgi:hypothetical protein
LITLAYLEKVSFQFHSLRHTPKFAELHGTTLHYAQSLHFHSRRLFGRGASAADPAILRTLLRRHKNTPVIG